jgi:folate-binding protein YgfZ
VCFDEGSVAEQFAALRHGVGGRVLVRDTVTVRGPDATSYLQGQCTQDVEVLAVGASAEALLLGPQGKIEGYVRVTRRADDEFLLDSEAGTGADVLARLQRFKLRVKAELEPGAAEVLCLRGADAATVAADVGGAGTALAYAWGPVVGVDVLGVPAGATVPVGVVPCGEEAWEAMRVAAGIPTMAAELAGRIPAEVAPLLERCVSFTKGCYTGQELVARLDARGNKVARQLGAVVMAGQELPAVGDDVMLASDAVGAGGAVPPDDGDDDHASNGAEGGGGRSGAVGALTSLARIPGVGVAGLAFLHRRVVPPAAVLVGERRLVGEARQLPLLTD